MKFNVGDVVVLVREEEVYGMTRAMRAFLEDGTPLKVLSSVNSYSEVESLGSPSGTFYASNTSLAPLSPGKAKLWEEEKKKKERFLEEAFQKYKTGDKGDLESLAITALKEGGDPGSNGVAVHVREGKELTRESGPCHGFIRNRGDEKSLFIASLAVRSCSSYKQTSEEVYLAYFDWLINRSPWRNCYITKDVGFIKSTGAILVRTDVPANMLQGALISTRNTWEFRPQIELWYEMAVKQGVNEHWAFIAAMMLSPESSERVTTAPMARDHIAINTRTISKEGVEAFCKHLPLFTTKEYNKGGCYGGVTQAFEGKDSFIFSGFEKAFKKYGERSRPILNPFEKAKQETRVSYSLPLSSLGGFITEFFTNLLKEKS